MFQLDRTQRDGLLLILLTVFGYSTFPLWVNLLSKEGLPSLDIATWRFIFAAPMIWLIVTGRGSRPLSIPIPRGRLLLAGMLMAAAAVTGVMGVQIIPASIYVSIFYSNPAIIALISLLLGERLGAQTWLALGLTLVGVVLTVPDLSEGLQQGANLTGVTLALINAFVVAIYYHATSRLLRGCDDTLRASVYSVFGALIPLVAIALVRGLMMPTRLEAWVLLLGFAGFCTVMPMAALNAGIQKLGAPRASILSTVEPLLTLIWSVLLLGERPQAIQLVGGALILTSVLLLQLRRSSPEAPAALPQDQAASI